VGLEFFLKLIKLENLPRWPRTFLLLIVGMTALYAVAGGAATGAKTMQVNLPMGLFLAVCGLLGIGVGWLAWTQGNAAPVTPTAAASPPAQTTNQSSTGNQSPNIVGDNATVIYHAPSSKSAEEMTYRGVLADEISASLHSLDKSRNRWYTASVGNNRLEAQKNWTEAETRMQESAALLRKKVSTTAEREFRQIRAGEPLAHPNLRLPYLPDGAAISEMWNRVTRLQEIEKRVRNGTEPIVYPPPAP
jgi:hypothetical protein